MGDADREIGHAHQELLDVVVAGQLVQPVDHLAELETGETAGPAKRAELGDLSRELEHGEVGRVGRGAV